MRNQLKNNLGKITDFKGTPLFGQDSIPQNTSNFLAIAGTILFWLIMLIVLLFVKPIEKKPKYKEVQIVLSSTPTVKKEEAPAPAEAASSAATQSELLPKETAAQPAPTVAEPKPVVAEKKPAVAEPVEAQKKPVEAQKKPTVTEKKPVTAEKKPAAAEKKPAVAEKKSPVAEPVEVYAVDPMEAFAQQTKKTPKKEFDWSMFDDDEPVENTNSAEPVKKVQNDEPLFSGSAATSADSSSQPVTSTNSSAKTNQTASGSTSSSLARISNTNFSGKAANGVESETNVKSAVSGSGKVMMEMSNGSSRALLDPAKPVINLSEAAAATIDGSRTVKIRFRVVEAGNVPRGEIKITPESILSDIVKTEVLDQISKWRFEPADYTAFAEFEYKIVKR